MRKLTNLYNLTDEQLLLEIAELKNISVFDLEEHLKPLTDAGILEI